MIYSGVISFGLGKAIQATIGFRAAVTAEHSGIDLGEHSEVGYDLTPVQHSAYRVRQTLYIGADESVDASRK